MATDLDLSALTAAVEKMTPGPWMVSETLEDEPVVFMAGPIENSATVLFQADWGEMADADGLVALRNAAPALLAEVAAARQMRCENGCKHRLKNYTDSSLRVYEWACERTAIRLEGMPFAMTPCASLGHGCRAWEARC
jgi:hypothetical protein